MTITSSPATETAERRLSAADQARQRRARRNAKIAAQRGTEPLLNRARAGARRVPFVAVLVALLGAGLAGVLWLNTLTDEAGIRTNAAKNAAAAAQLEIESLNSDIASKNATPAIADAARKLGLVPAGDAAILVVPTDGGTPSVVGTPIPVVDPAVIAAEAAATSAAAQAAAEQAAAEAAAQAAAQAAAESAAAQSAADAAAQSAADPAPQPPADPNAAATSNVAAVPADRPALGDAVATTNQGAAG